MLTQGNTYLTGSAFINSFNANLKARGLRDEIKTVAFGGEFNIMTDMIQHSYATYLLTNSEDGEFAYAIGAIREVMTPFNEKWSFLGNTVDRQMDMINNTVGINIAQNKGVISKIEIIESILNEYEIGRADTKGKFQNESLIQVRSYLNCIKNHGGY